MSNPLHKNSHSEIFINCFFGVIRGAVVLVTTYPLDTIKTNQQLYQVKSYQAALQIFQREGGIRPFYKGFLSQVYRYTFKQLWMWPIIKNLPSKLAERNITPLNQNLITGVTIGSLDAVINSPLERLKILSMVGMKTFTWNELKAQGWLGFGYQWRRSTWNWCSFLVAQEFFTNKVLSRTDRKKLNLLEIFEVGAETALVTSITSAPLDAANTIIQTNKLSKEQHSSIKFLSGNFLKIAYKGWSLSLVSYFIHNVTSVALVTLFNK